MDRIDVALLGLGTVGTGVYKMLQSNQDVIARRIRTPVRSEAHPGSRSEQEAKSGRSAAPAHYPVRGIMATGVDVVMEAMGGVEPAELTSNGPSAPDATW